MTGDSKKALYGLAFLVTERIVDRRGVEGLHALATRSDLRRETEANLEAFLAAAELTRDPEDWRRAISAAVGPAERAEISRMLPGVLLPGEAGTRGASEGGSSPVASRLDPGRGQP